MEPEAFRIIQPFSNLVSLITMKNPFVKVFLFLLPQSILIDIQIISFCTTLVETTIYHELCKMNTPVSVRQIFGNKRFDG